MSNIDKQALREVAERATPGNWRRTSSLFNGITVTPFSLCGEEVTLAHTVEKRDAEFIAAANPRTMLALLDENIQLQREKDAIEAVALALRDDMRQAREQLEESEKRNVELESKNGYLRTIAHEQNELAIRASLDSNNATVEMGRLHKRIAELEARKVNLSKLSVGEVMHMSGFSRDYAEGWCAGNDNAIHEIRTAGIKVKES
ncbi:ead/Ea22-like family protein [Salmonella enterica]|uniref:Ead/Ea22-like family protein n=1 Tax=Salmonella enterica TaxID=28901 RepID=A0A5Y6GA52_SALER|nr:ead/Ea22-like family protein [Salmonella enterica]EBH3482535.1 ead/Ea22-like family protein [Salmonella enterica subsp. enterica serovar Haifa]ECC9091383.1 ead/Ea22-like family protein [Salmonella enterica subsp. enterica]EDQ4488619.1 ead/Ea22-like family protein [Salmonella enterica subsp. enterica serovar Java]EAN9947951.1 ead/Ea22-like family protein [Salmonella enterica]EAO5569614.1 ead/Ea22-like family protein [Salmonella enterica]